MPSYSCKYGHSYEPLDAKRRNWICPLDNEPLRSEQRSALGGIDADCGRDEPVPAAVDRPARPAKR